MIKTIYSLSDVQAAFDKAVAARNELPAPAPEATELQPCPFCGCAAKLSGYQTGQGFGESYDLIGVTCSSCAACVMLGGYGVGDHTRDPGRLRDAIEVWNRRQSASSTTP
jgi:hypothetical protein